MLVIIAAVLFVGGVLFALSAFGALLRLRLIRFTLRSLTALLLLVAGGVLGVIALGSTGLQALTGEHTAARIQVTPTGPQRYNATVRLADGRTETYELAGDDIYVDAHIVKWTPLANQLGLDTSYRLDRISGRYRSVDKETTERRTVYSLAPPGPIDLVAIGRRFPLAAFFDAEYGSATYVPVASPAELELKVSTTGLLMRPAAAAPAALTK